MCEADESTSTESLLVISGTVRIRRSNLTFTFARSGGPGGQAVNKISTKATLRVPIAAIENLPDDAAARLRTMAGRRLTQDDEIVISAESHRSQLMNKEECLSRLTEMIRAALVKPKVRKKKKPTRGMIERRLKSKRRSSEKKQLRRTRRTRGEND